MLSFFAACGAAFGRVQGLAWCGETNLASFDLFQGKPIVLSFFSLSAVRPSAGRRAWLGVVRQTWQALICFREIRSCFCFFRCLRCGLLPGARLGVARQTWQALICFREIRSCFRFFSLSAVRPSAGRRDWFGVAGHPVRLSSVFSLMAVPKLAHFPRS